MINNIYLVGSSLLAAFDVVIKLSTVTTLHSKMLLPQPRVIDILIKFSPS